MATPTAQFAPPGARLGLTLAVAAVAVSICKLFLTGLFLYIALFCVFAAGFLLLNVQRFGDAFAKPRSRFGMSVCAGYFVVTLTAFFALGQKNFSDFVAQFSTSFLSTSFVLVGIAVPIFEELFFRGGLQFAFEKKIEASDLSRKRLWTLYASALAFWIFHWPLDTHAWGYALSHFGIPVGPGPFLLGLVCAAIVAFDRSIAWAVVFHGLTNAMGGFWLPALKLQWIVDLFYV